MGVQGIYKRDSTGRRYLAYTIKEDSEGRRTTKSYTSKGQEIIQSQQKAEAEAQKRIEEIQRAEAQKKELIQAQEKVKAQQQEQIKQERIIQAQTQAIQQQSETQPTFRPNQQQSRVTINEPAPQQTQTTQYPTRYDIEGNPYTPAPKITTETKDVGSRTYQTEAGLVTETTKETTTTLSFKEPNFKDVIGYNKYKKKLEEADLERYKKEGIDLKQIKITGGEAVIPKPTKEQNAVLLEASRGVNKQNIDKVFQSDILKQAKYERMQQTGTSLEQSDFLRQAVPEVFQRQTQQIQAERNVQEFFQKERAKTTAILVGTTIATAGAGTLITAGISSLAVSSPVLAGTIATGTKVIGTGLKYVYGASVVKRGTAIATGYDFSFKEMKIIQPYENKPIARSIDAIQLIAEVGGVYLGAKIISSKKIDAGSYKETGTQVLETGKGKLVFQTTGTATTKGGATRLITTKITAVAGQQPTFQTIATNQAGKIVIRESGLASLDSRAFTKVNPYNIVKPESQRAFSILQTDGIYRPSSNYLIASQTPPFTTESKLVLTGKVSGKTTKLFSQGRVQYLDYSNVQGGQKYEILETTKGLITSGNKATIIDATKGQVTNVDKFKLGSTATLTQTTPEPLSQFTTYSQTETPIKTLTFKNNGGLRSSLAFGLDSPLQFQESGAISRINTQLNLDTNIKATTSQIGLFTKGVGLGGTLTLPETNLLVVPLGLGGTKTLPSVEEQALARINTSSITRTSTQVETTTQAITDTIPIVETISRTTGGTKTKVETQTEPITEPITEIITTPVTPPPPTIITTTTIVPPPQFDFPKLEKTKQKAGKGFDVLVRSKGKFVKVNVGGSLTETQALDFGAFKVATSPLASFKIQESTAPLTTINGKSRGMFTRTRRNLYTKDNVFIEKKEKRIKSFGEKVGITYKGLKTIKEKKTKGIFEKWKVF
jgi:hypothetical protein